MCSDSELWVQRYRAEKKIKERTMERCSPFSMSSWQFNTVDVLNKVEEAKGLTGYGDPR